MTCGGSATHSAYDPYRAFNTAATSSGILPTAGIRRGGGSYGNPPGPQPYAYQGQIPYTFPPAPGPAGPVPPSQDIYGDRVPQIPDVAAAKAPKSTTTSSSYSNWPTNAKAALWATVGSAAFIITLIFVAVVLRQTRRF
jgi:hypothetical protein